MLRILNRFTKDRSGASALEYAFIIGIMAAGILAGMTMLTPAVQTPLRDAGDNLSRGP
jgi:Flp pilus assembly pilin Flp